MNSRLLNNDIIKAEAKRLGFFACGIAKAERVDKAEERCLNRWIAEGNYANMEYMANHTDIRLDPRLLLNGAKIIVCGYELCSKNFYARWSTTDGCIFLWSRLS